MSEYKRGKKYQILALLTAVVFILLSIPNLLNNRLWLAGVQLLVGVLWLMNYYQWKKPYLTLRDGLLKINFGIFKQIEVKISDIEIVMEGNKFVEFLNKTSNRKTYISLNQLSNEDYNMFKQELIELINTK